MDFPRLTAYLAALSEHNEKAWFEANRAEYQALRDEFSEFVGEVIARLSGWEEAMRWVDPKDCIFRIHRDVRFSGDKRPYKTVFSAYLSERGRRGEGPGHYFHVDERGTLLAAGGIYQPSPEQLARIRERDVRDTTHGEALDYLTESFRAMRPFQSWLRGALGGASGAPVT